jgi:long-chain acyl-CoA synthetase
MALFKNSENFYPDRIAIISDKYESIKYSELENISSSLQSKIPERSLVFSLNKNTSGSLCGYYSFLKNKIVPLMLDANMNLSLIKELIDNYRPEYLWLPNENVSEFSYNKEIYSVFDYTLIKINNKKKFSLHKDLALLLGTSGSTGSPKLVKLTYENIESNAKSIIEYLSINKNERPITTLPMSYSFGLSIINSHLLSAATLLLTNNSIFEKDFWKFFNSEKATSLSGVPFTFEMLRKLRFFNMDIPSLKTITQAGGKLNDELNLEFAKYCKNTGKQFFVMYGQTEATARMSYLPYQDSLKKLGSIGIAIPNGELSLIDENKIKINQPNIEGELVYKGSNVSMGYAKCCEDLERGDENKGILQTGDLAKRDEDGYYYIVGRKKRFIKLYGNRVNLDETERIIKNIIPDCACAGTDDKLLIYITQKEFVQKIKLYVSSKIGINSRAFQVRCIDKIPKNSSGKTIYSKLSI